MRRYTAGIQQTNIIELKTAACSTNEIILIVRGHFEIKNVFVSYAGDLVQQYGARMLDSRIRGILEG